MEKLLTIPTRGIIYIGEYESIYKVNMNSKTFELCDYKNAIPNMVCEIMTITEEEFMEIEIDSDFKPVIMEEIEIQKDTLMYQLNKINKLEEEIK